LSCVGKNEKGKNHVGRGKRTFVGRSKKMQRCFTKTKGKGECGSRRNAGDIQGGGAQEGGGGESGRFQSGAAPRRGGGKGKKETGPRDHNVRKKKKAKVIFVLVIHLEKKRPAKMKKTIAKRKIGSKRKKKQKRCAAIFVGFQSPAKSENSRAYWEPQKKKRKKEP